MQSKLYCVFTGRSNGRETKTPAKRPRDASRLAKHVIDVATGEASDEEPEPSGRTIGGRTRRDHDSRGALGTGP